MGGTKLGPEASSHRPGLSEQREKLAEVRACLCLSKAETEENYFLWIW